MRAVIVCAGVSEPLATLTGGAPAALLPLVDRPFLQHVLEHLAGHGFRQIDLILSDGAEQVERLVGDGRRWGQEVTVHLARDPKRPYRAIPEIPAATSVLLGHADRLPSGGWAAPGQVPEGPMLLVDATGAWTGWASVTGDHLAFPRSGLDEAALGEQLASLPGATRCGCDQVLAATSAEELLRSQHRVLDGQIAWIRVQGRRIAPGIRVGRGAVIDATAELTGPVYVGELAEVAPGVRLGPNTVVGHGCVIGSGSALSEALVGAHTFVGAGLDVHRAIAAGEQLLKVDLATVVRVPDRALLASLAGADRRPVGWLSRLAALVLLVVTLPILAVTAGVLLVTRGRVLFLRVAAREPVGQGHARAEFRWATFLDPEAGAPGAWAHLVLYVLPGLVEVVGGRLGVVGTEPRTAEGLAALPAEWQGLIARVRPGLLTEGTVTNGPAGSEPERILADAWYAAHSSRRYDLRLLAAYAARLVRGRPVPIAVPQG